MQEKNNSREMNVNAISLTSKAYSKECNMAKKSESKFYEIQKYDLRKKFDG